KNMRRSSKESIPNSYQWRIGGWENAGGTEKLPMRMRSEAETVPFCAAFPVPYRAFSCHETSRHVTLSRLARASSANRNPEAERVGKKVSKLLVAHDIATANTLPTRQLTRCSRRRTRRGRPHHAIRIFILHHHGQMLHAGAASVEADRQTGEVARASFLMASDEPQDIYQPITEKVEERELSQTAKDVPTVEVRVEYLNALRKAVGLHIDPETAEVEWTYAQTLDPYGDGLDLPEEYRCV